MLYSFFSSFIAFLFTFASTPNNINTSHQNTSCYMDDGLSFLLPHCSASLDSNLTETALLKLTTVQYFGFIASVVLFSLKNDNQQLLSFTGFTTI